MRRKSHFLAFAVILIISFSFCNGASRAELAYAPGQKILLSKDKAKPIWTGKEGGIGKISGKKYVFFKGEADSKYRKSAMESAKADARAKAANSISVLIATQYAEAWESLGTGKREDMETVREGLIATKGTVRLSGLRLLNTYTEQLGVVETVEDGNPKFSHREVRAYALFGINYDRYIKIRDRLINKVSKTVEANSRQKKLIGKIQGALKKLDRLESYRLNLSGDR